MDSMRHDLLDALALCNALAAAAEPTAGQACTATVSTARYKCMQCGVAPATDIKMRYCGRCKMTKYCSRECALADWPKHKLMCEIKRVDRNEALATHEAQGGRKNDMNQRLRDEFDWFRNVPGLTSETELLAWKHRSKTPLMHVTTSKSDVDGSAIQIQMIPRSQWESNFSDNKRKALCEIFDDSSFCVDTQYVCAFAINREGQQDPFTNVVSMTLRDQLSVVRGIEIVEALSAATSATDLADAFVWFKNTMQSQSHSARILAHINMRALFLHGGTALEGSIPAPTRAINNEVAIMMMHSCLQLEFSIRLTGLCGAAHLNGREGVISEIDKTTLKRWKVRLNDGTYVSVRPHNFVHICRGDYKRISPSDYKRMAGQ